MVVRVAPFVMDIRDAYTVDAFLSNLVESFTLPLNSQLWDTHTGHVHDGGIDLVSSDAAPSYRAQLSARQDYHTYNSSADAGTTRLTFHIQMSGSSPGFWIQFWNVNAGDDYYRMTFAITGGTAYLNAWAQTPATTDFDAARVVDSTAFTELDTYLNFEFTGPTSAVGDADEFRFKIQAGPGPTGPWTTLFAPTLDVDLGQASLVFKSFNDTYDTSTGDAYTASGTGADSTVFLSAINTMHADSINETFGPLADFNYSGPSIFFKSRQISAADPDPAWHNGTATFSKARPPGTGVLSGGTLDEYPALHGELKLDLSTLISTYVGGGHYFQGEIQLVPLDFRDVWPGEDADFFAGIDYPWHLANRIEIVWAYNVSIMAYYRYAGVGGLTITAEPNLDYIDDASQVEFGLGPLLPATIKAVDSWDIDYPGIHYTVTDPPGLSIPTVRRYNGAFKTDVILTSPLFGSDLQTVFPLEVKADSPLPGMMIARTGGTDEAVWSSVSAQATPVAIRLHYPEFIRSDTPPLDTPDLGLEPPEIALPDLFLPGVTLPSTCGADNPPAPAVPCGAGSATILELVRQFSSQVRRAVRITGSRTIEMVDPNAAMPGALVQDDADHMYTNVTLAARAGEKTLRLGKGEVSMSASATLKSDDVRVIHEGWQIPGRLPALTVPPSAVKRVQYDFTPRGFTAGVDFHIPDDTIRARRPT